MALQCIAELGRGLHTIIMSCWPRILLLGDSITQYSTQMNGWGAAVASLVQRKCDVMNRGFSGYNSDNIVQYFDQIIGKDMKVGRFLYFIFAICVVFEKRTWF